MNLELVGFLTVSFFIAITPGPSVIYVVSYSLRYGSRAGIVSTLGVNAGSIVFILIAAFGLSTLLDSYPKAITLIQLMGACYVMYLGLKMWPRDSAITIAIESEGLKRAGYRELFCNGFVTSILNPKDILFYTAFIPAFIPNAVSSSMPNSLAGAVPSLVVGKSYTSQFLMLSFLYIAIGFITKSLLAVFAGQSKSALNSRYAGIINYLAALILLLLGLFLMGKSVSSLLYAG